MSKVISVAVAMVVAAGVAGAAEAGSSAAAFLKIGVGARAVGMGEAQAALAEGPDALYWNPAGLAVYDRGAVAFTHNEWLEDVRYEYLGLSYPLLNLGTFAFSAGRVDLGTIEGRNEQGELTGEFSASDLLLSFGYARRLLPFLSVGVAAEYITEKIEVESASTFAGAFGVTADTPLPGLSAGASLAHLGGEMKFIQEGDPLPLAIRGGAAYLLPFGGENNSLTVAADAVKFDDRDTVHVNSGLEYWFMDTVAARAGYKGNYDEDGLTGGLGFKYSPSERLGLQADYAYADMGIFGATHRLSLGILF
ncbi:MAG: PorV/PorQ family protein [Candidatus Coatesbacteria bacterium]|nr:MAG: PorV/PorQ family protein [Candidatus Coatesbacteria bacterium]